MMTKKILVCFAFLFYTGISKAQFLAQNKELSLYLAEIQKAPELSTSSWSLCVRSAITGEILMEHNKNLSLVPASSLKLVTTSATLSILGADYRFKTGLYQSGNTTKEGLLVGNLVVIGGGDPTFGSERWEQTKLKNIFALWVNELKNKNIKEIQGDLILDASIFDKTPVPGTWLWEDIGNYYGAGVSGLSILENTFEITLAPANMIGEKAVIVSTNPAIPTLILANNVYTCDRNEKENIVCYSAPFSSTCFIEGSLPIHKKQTIVKASVPDPIGLFGKLLLDFLAKEGIFLTGKIIQSNTITFTDNLVPLITHYSPRLDEIVLQTHLKSINLFAESLVKMCGAKQNYEGSFENGLNAIKEFWESKGIPLIGFTMNDGSGLSRTNLISTRLLSEMLVKMQRDSSFTHFYNSIAIGAKTGNAANMFKSTAAENNIRIKSGYMKGIRSYAGYTTNASNELLCFSIITNNLIEPSQAIKKKFEKLLILVSESKSK